MKEIKAYIRTACLEETVKALEEKGAPGITVVTVHPVGYGFNARFSLSPEEVTRRFYDIVKIELVCDKEDLDTFVNTILDCSHTGDSGDGLIFVSDVKEVVKIRNRQRGNKISEVSGQSLSSQRRKMTKDPVCGMQVEESKAAAKSEYEGKTYYFCCIACKEKFDKSPKMYEVYGDK